MLKYYPLTLVPSLQKINKFTPTNPYANWQSVAGHMLPKDANGKDIQWASEQYPYDPNTWPKEVRHLFDSTGTPRRPGKRLIPPLAASGLQRIDRGDKMMEHPLEERRQKRVARRRRLGKGPPRKGESFAGSSARSVCSLADRNQVLDEESRSPSNHHECTPVSDRPCHRFADKSSGLNWVMTGDMASTGYDQHNLWTQTLGLSGIRQSGLPTQCQFAFIAHGGLPGKL